MGWANEAFWDGLGVYSSHRNEEYGVYTTKCTTEDEENVLRTIGRKIRRIDRIMHGSMNRKMQAYLYNINDINNAEITKDAWYAVRGIWHNFRDEKWKLVELAGSINEHAKARYNEFLDSAAEEL